MGNTGGSDGEGSWMVGLVDGRIACKQVCPGLDLAEVGIPGRGDVATYTQLYCVM